ncbi:MAG: PEP-CTERM sorting domain-containing protein [Nitrospiraceae bacterium]|nr:PEP-CTERM sorting domain-containing protein [Nitrospiraceae bacterium]
MWATLTGFLIFLLFSGRPQEALANYYEVTASGTWSTFSQDTASVFSSNGGNNGNWEFSFDLPASLTLSSQTNSLSTSSGLVFSYPGLTTYQAQNFQLNNLASTQDAFVNQSGSHSGTFGSFGSGTFYYSGGITFGTGSTISGGVSGFSDNGFLFETCLSGCQTEPSLYGPDGFFVSVPGTNGILLSSSTDTTGNSLNLFSGNIDLNLDGGAGIGSGTMSITEFSGQIPGTGQGTLAATPEPASWLLFGTGMLLMGGVAVRRRERLNRI